MKRAPMKKPIAATVATLAGVALIAGCGGGDAETTRAPSGGGSVEQQLGFSRADSPDAQAKAENEIAACMRAQGFEYIPVDPVAAQAALTGKCCDCGKRLPGCPRTSLRVIVSRRS